MRTDLDAFVSYGRGRLNRLRHRASQIGYAAPPPVRVTILSGMHAGISIDLNASEFTIGPETDHDVMLLDRVLRDGPVKVEVAGTLMGPIVTVVSDRTDVFVGNEALADYMDSEKLPCVINIDGVALRLDPIPSEGISTLRRFGIAVATCSLIALVLMGLQVESRAATPNRLALPSTKAPFVEGSDVSQQRERIEAAIQSAGISDYLTVVERGGRTVFVSGSLPSNKMDQWNRIRQNADANLDDVVLLSDIKSMAKLSNLPAVSAVKLGEVLKLVLFDGRELGVGDMLSAQWIIEGITAEGFTISRQGEIARLTF